MRPMVFDVDVIQVGYAAISIDDNIENSFILLLFVGQPNASEVPMPLRGSLCKEDFQIERWEG